jgi:integrase/recombinase XerD
MESASSTLDPGTSQIALPATPGVVVARLAPADQRHAEHVAGHSPDHWVRTEAWRDRWLVSKLNLDTRAAYRLAFASLMEVGEELGVAPLAMSRVDIDRWVEILRSYGNPTVTKPQKLSDTSLARYMATASSFYKYCLRWPCADPDCATGDNGRCGAPWLLLNPVPDGDARPRASGESPQQHLSPEQVRAVVTSADKHGARASALMALLTNCLRISEAVGTDIADLREDRGHKTIRVVGKRRKQRTVPLPPPAWRRVQAAIGGRTEGPILTTRTGRLDRTAAWELVQELARSAGIEGAIGPHTFRHAVITHALKAKIPLADVQDWAGHSDSRTTRRYDRRRDDHDNSPTYILAGNYFGGDE